MISTKATTGPAHAAVVTATKLSLGTNQHNVPIETRAHPNPRHHGFQPVQRKTLLQNCARDRLDQNGISTRFARKTTSLLPPTKHRWFVNLTPLRSVRHEKQNTLTDEFLCVASLAQMMSAQTLVCQTARSGPLGRDFSWQALACGTARSWRCVTSCRGHSASSHSAQKLGESHACGTTRSWTARPCVREGELVQAVDDRHNTISSPAVESQWKGKRSPAPRGTASLSAVKGGSSTKLNKMIGTSLRTHS